MKATQTIWRTVVFAGAMLGSGACSKKQANTTPTPTNNATKTDDAAKMGTDAKPDPANQTPAKTDGTADGAGDPCAGGEARPRGGHDNGGGAGRGFVLS